MTRATNLATKSQTREFYKTKIQKRRKPTTKRGKKGENEKEHEWFVKGTELYNVVTTSMVCFST